MSYPLSVGDFVATSGGYCVVLEVRKCSPELGEQEVRVLYDDGYTSWIYSDFVVKVFDRHGEEQEK